MADAARCFQDDDRARAFAEIALGCRFSDPLIGLVIEDQGQVVGAVILNDYTMGRNIEVSAAGHCWSVRIIRDVLRYCFRRVERITARTSVNNTAAIKGLTAIGFKQEGVMREFFADGDAIVFGLLKSEQKLIKDYRL